MKQIIRIATRQSPLALWQAHYVRDQLIAYHPDLSVELIPMITRGDVILDSPLSKIGGKGLFVKELELALLDKRADIAVHSMKDVPITFPDGLGLTTICQRDDCRDAFISNKYKTLHDLPKGSIVGTSSLRRQCQLKALRDDFVIRDLRGNVGTRLSKLDNNEYDAIILAAAGLKRLNMAERIQSYLPPETSLPAGGQGAIGIECRLDDSITQQLLMPLDHEETRICVTAERAVNIRLEGGCQVPIASYAKIEQNQLWLRALVGAVGSGEIIRGERRGAINQANNLGTDLAEELLKRGADKILSQIYSTTSIS